MAAALTQAEADGLLAMGKHRVDDKVWSPPHRGGSVTIPLVSVDGRESFLLDLRRGRINLAKSTYQNRVRQVFVLARLDVGGPPHRNPDDEVIPCPHSTSTVKATTTGGQFPSRGKSSRILTTQRKRCGTS